MRRAPKRRLESEGEKQAKIDAYKAAHPEVDWDCHEHLWTMVFHDDNTYSMEVTSHWSKREAAEAYGVIGMPVKWMEERDYARFAPSAQVARDGGNGGDQEPADQGTGEHGRQLDA